METLASIFGMSADEVVKLIGAFSLGVATILGAVAKLFKSIHGARRRSFQKIRRLEDIAEITEKNRRGEVLLLPGGEPLTRLFAEMKADQRDDSDAKDSE